MAFSRHLGVIGILSVSWFVAVGCGDDGDKNVAGDGGEAGEGGEASGGKSTSGGSANNAGKGGNAAAGKGGTANAGSGGTPTGGTAGSATIGGAGAGNGGDDAGGAGGTPGPGAGGAGAGGVGVGGDGGAGGAPEVGAAKKCDWGCNVDADCNGIDSVGHCDQTLKRCRSTDCTVSADCAPLISQWTTPCTNDSQCTPDVERCVAWQGDGYCAGLPDPQVPEFPCFFGFPTTMPLFGAVGEAEVCADLTHVCNNGACEPGCANPLLGCGAGTGDTCNPTTGLCECAQSTECTKAGVSVCGGNGVCGCADDTDCAKNAGVTGLGKCVNGTCGCDSAATCLSGAYPNATKVCE